MKNKGKMIEQTNRTHPRHGIGSKCVPGLPLSFIVKKLLLKYFKCPTAGFVYTCEYIIMYNAWFAK